VRDGLGRRAFSEMTHRDILEDLDASSLALHFVELLIEANATRIPLPT
jgi:hypothetical protein